MYSGFQLKLDVDGDENSSSSPVKQDPHHQHLEVSNFKFVYVFLW